jgi:hypothetical protein
MKVLLFLILSWIITLYALLLAREWPTILFWRRKKTPMEDLHEAVLEYEAQQRAAKGATVREILESQESNPSSIKETLARARQAITGYSSIISKNEAAIEVYKKGII